MPNAYLNVPHTVGTEHNLFLLSFSRLENYGPETPGPFYLI